MCNMHMGELAQHPGIWFEQTFMTTLLGLASQLLSLSYYFSESSDTSFLVSSLATQTLTSAFILLPTLFLHSLPPLSTSLSRLIATSFITGLFKNPDEAFGSRKSKNYGLCKQFQLNSGSPARRTQMVAGSPFVHTSLVIPLPPLLWLASVPLPLGYINQTNLLQTFPRSVGNWCVDIPPFQASPASSSPSQQIDRSFFMLHWHELHTLRNFQKRGSAGYSAHGHPLTSREMPSTQSH